MPTRTRPAVEIRCYDEGQGDPYLTDAGFVWTDDLAQTARYGEMPGEAYFGQALQMVDGMLIPRATARYQTTGAWTAAVAHASTSLLTSTFNPGSILEYYATRVSTAGPCQIESQWSDPPGAVVGCGLDITVIAIPLWDKPSIGFAEPIYHRIQFGIQAGTPQWTLAWQSHVSTFREPGWLLETLPDGQVTRCMPLPALETTVVILREADGALLISLDRGASYHVYRRPDGSPCTLRGGKQGYATNYTSYTYLYPIKVTLPTATYRSRQQATGKTRVAPSVTLTPKGSTPYGTSITLADVGSPVQQIAQYTATLTPEAVPGVYFDHYRGPALRSVQYEISPTVSTPTQNYAVVPASYLSDLAISKPEDIATSACTLRLRARTSVDWDDYLGRYRKYVVRLGWEQDDGSITDWRTVYTGYLVRARRQRLTVSTHTLELELGNLSTWLRTAPWLPEHDLVLGGRTVGAAGDEILRWAGIPRNSSYRSWAAICNTFPLPYGSHSRPHERTRPGESRWATLERIMATAGCRMAVGDDGVVSSVTDTHVTGVIHDYYCSGTTDVDKFIQSLTEEVDYRETGTRCYGVGEGEQGERYWAYAVDDHAETQTGSGRFCPWPAARVDDYPSSLTPGIMAARVGRAATDWFGLRRILEQGVPMNPSVGRLDQVRLYGALEVADGTLATVRAVGHQYRVDPATGESTWETRALLKL